MGTPVSVAVLISGKLHAVPVTRSTREGTEYVTAKVRVDNRSQTEWWDVIAFGDEARAHLAGLEEGDPIAMSGEPSFDTYKHSCGETRIARRLTADRVMALRPAPRRRRPAARRAEAMEGDARV